MFITTNHKTACTAANNKTMTHGRLTLHQFLHGLVFQYCWTQAKNTTWGLKTTSTFTNYRTACKSSKQQTDEKLTLHHRLRGLLFPPKCTLSETHNLGLENNHYPPQTTKPHAQAANKGKEGSWKD